MTLDPQDPKRVEERKNQEDPIVMYLIVREALNMSIGKTAAQVGHAVGMLFLKREELIQHLKHTTTHSLGLDKYEVLLKQAAVFSKWLDLSYRKVSLKADEKEWIKLKELTEFKNSGVIVIDNGLTELAPQTETVIGLFPMYKSEVPKTIKRLQLLK